MRKVVSLLLFFYAATMAAQEEMVGVPKQELENANIQMERLK